MVPEDIAGYIEKLRVRGRELETALADPAIYAKTEECRRISREHRKLESLFEKFDAWTGALDQTTGHEIMSILMRTARQTGAAVVVVTHDSNVAAFCDATVTLRDGRLSSPQQSQPTAGGAR